MKPYRKPGSYDAKTHRNAHRKLDDFTVPRESSQNWREFLDDLLLWAEAPASAAEIEAAWVGPGRPPPLAIGFEDDASEWSSDAIRAALTSRQVWLSRDMETMWRLRQIGLPAFLAVDDLKTTMQLLPRKFDFPSPGEVEVFLICDSDDEGLAWAREAFSAGLATGRCVVGAVLNGLECRRDRCTDCGPVKAATGRILPALSLLLI